jgi:hypothetical protein
MGIEDIWPRLAPQTQEWLIANNGDAVPDDIAAEIDVIVDAVGSDDVWADDEDEDVPIADDEDDDEIEGEDDGDEDEEDYGGRYLTDDVVDWIEELANQDER